MLTLTGIVQKIYKTAASQDRQTGEIRPPRAKAQILGEIPVKGGDTKLEIVELNVTDALGAFEAAKGRTVRVNVALYHVEDNAGLYFVKGSKIELLDEKGNVAKSIDSTAKAAA